MPPDRESRSNGLRQEREKSQKSPKHSSPPAPNSRTFDLQRNIGNLAFGQMMGVDEKGSHTSRKSTQDKQAPEIVHEVLQSPGQPLDRTTRSRMESRFNHDFGSVRVHTDPKAATSAS